MKCAHLVACRNVLACSVHDRPYVPSLSDLDEYCKTVDHMDCPLYAQGTFCINKAESDTEKSIPVKKSLLA